MGNSEKIVHYRIVEAMKDVSRIIGKSHAREVTRKAHELSYVKVLLVSSYKAGHDSG